MLYFFDLVIKKFRVFILNNRDHLWRRQECNCEEIKFNTSIFTHNIVNKSNNLINGFFFPRVVSTVEVVLKIQIHVVILYRLR